VPRQTSESGRSLWLGEGKIARRQLYWTREEAAEAAGLRE
jgi:hypothetical protein